jgi:hypothetical protein
MDLGSVVELLRIVVGKVTCELNRVSSPPNPAQKAVYRPFPYMETILDPYV